MSRHTRRASRAARRDTAAYLTTARRIAPSIAASASDEQLVRIGAAMLVLGAADLHALGDGIAAAEEHAPRHELTALFLAAGTHLGTHVLGEPA